MVVETSENEILAEISDNRTLKLREINTNIVYNSQPLKAFDAEFLARSLLVSSAYLSAEAPPIEGKVLGDGIIPIRGLRFEAHQDIQKIVMRITFAAGVEISVIIPALRALETARDLAQSAASILQTREAPKTAH